MMDLPLATMTASPSSTGGAMPAGRSEDPEGFAAALTSLLGDAGNEVVEMVEALETLAGLQGAERAELAGIGWPLPAYLALSGEQAAGAAGDLGDGAAAEVDALLEQLLDTVEPVVEGVLAGGPEVAGELSVPTEGASGDPAGAEGQPSDPEVDGGGSGESDAAADDVAADIGRDELDQVLAAAVAASQAAGAGPTRDGEPTIEPDTAGRGRALLTADPAKADGGEPATPRTTDGARTAGAAEGGRVPGSASAAITVDAAGAEAAAEPSATLSGVEASRRASIDRNVGLPTAIQRIMDAVERLENQPPPRQLTLEIGELRLRVSMEDGHVRLSLLDGDRDAGDELLRDAEQELAQRGFDLGDETGGSPDHDAWPGQDAGPARPRTGPSPGRSPHDPIGAMRL